MELATFLVEAKEHSYGAFQPLQGDDLEDGAHQITYHREEFYYRNKYFGEYPFSGRETVSEDEKTLWSMHYTGIIVKPVVPKKELEKFISKALQHVPGDCPFRGPRRYEFNNFLYTNEANGGIENFYGIERIYYKGELIFKATYQGGLHTGQGE